MFSNYCGCRQPDEKELRAGSDKETSDSFFVSPFKLNTELSISSMLLRDLAVYHDRYSERICAKEYFFRN